MELELTKPFIGANTTGSLTQAGVYILGFCFDGTTSYRPGSRLGPDSLRAASANLEDYSPYLELDLSDYHYFDLGNLPFFPQRWDLIHQSFLELTRNFDPKKHKLISLGGEHSISYSPIELYLKHYPDLLIIQLDAHADLRDGYLGSEYSHASIIKRVWDIKNQQQEIIQYGIRSGTKEEFQFMHEHQSLVTSLDNLINRIENLGSRPIYLTLDLDFFDPAFMPGTGTPEAGGESFHSFVKILKRLKNKNLVGADITELAPNLDHSGISSCLAAKCTRELIMLLANQD